MTKVKICGITNLKDALFAADLGADELGFNFFRESPRYIAPEAAREIINKLPKSTESVGVFVNEELERIVDIVKTASITRVQLHGDESADLIRELRDRLGLFVIKSVRVSNFLDVEKTASFGADAVLLDSFKTGQFGGTGETFDWRIAARLSSLLPNIYLAGGLSPDVVMEAIEVARPFAVDACSCLESSPRKKDPEKVRSFIAKVRECR